MQGATSTDYLHTFEGLTPSQTLQRALEDFDQIAISFSGAEDVILLDMATELTDAVQVFSLDTGRLHAQTYQFLETVREHYGIDIDIMTPDPADLEPLVREKGLFSFYHDGHQECCAVRKIEPLRRRLSTLDAWITGQRQDQNPATRAALPIAQVDSAFSTDSRQLIKFNPLSAWTSADVWAYIRERDVPFNPLHNQGFRSIGCQPCTRPVGPHQHEREGRWWWEHSADKECGLHVINIEDPGP